MGARCAPISRCLAADLGDWHQAATLHGVAQAMLDQTGVPWEQADARRCQDGRDHARQALGGQQFHRAYARGMALSFDQAIDITLSGGLSAI